MGGCIRRMKIQFIICGWHMNQDTLIDGLLQLEKENSVIDVFWSCHKEPPQRIKDNFKWTELLKLPF